MRGPKRRWIDVSPAKPCPVCGHGSWCGVSEDGAVACCMRQPSAKEVQSGGGIGYIHKLDGSVQYEPDSKPRAETKRLSSEHLTKLAKRMFEHERADTRRRQVSSQLGVTLVSLELLRVGYGADRDGREFSSWPARDGKGRIVGIVRRYDDGEKRSWAGGSTGLFYELDWHKRPGPVFVVEGGSDTAACISAGVPAIGRPSNTGGGREIGQLLRGFPRARKPLVIGEDDEKPEKRGQSEACPVDCVGCGNCFPGRYGAVRVSELLGCPWVMPPAGCKDFRDAATKGRLGDMWFNAMQVL